MACCESDENNCYFVIKGKSSTSLNGFDIFVLIISTLLETPCLNGSVGQLD